MEGGVAVTAQETVVRDGGAPATTGHAEAAAAPPVLRSDFSETAFFQPQLLTGPDGSAVIEFPVPDSVTSWNVWVHAITKTARRLGPPGDAHRQGADGAAVPAALPARGRPGGLLKVVVNDAWRKRPVADELKLEIVDPDTEQERCWRSSACADEAPSAVLGEGRRQRER